MMGEIAVLIFLALLLFALLVVPFWGEGGYMKYVVLAIVVVWFGGSILLGNLGH